MEENILRSGFTRKKLNIVNDEYINHLIEVDKIIAGVFFD